MMRKIEIEMEIDSEIKGKLRERERYGKIENKREPKKSRGREKEI